MKRVWDSGNVGLAKTVGVSEQHVGQIKKGKKNASIDVQVKIADALGCEYFAFLKLGRRICEGKPPLSEPDELRSPVQDLTILVQSEENKHLLESHAQNYLGIPLYNDGRLAAGPGGLVFDPDEDPGSTVIVYRPELNNRQKHDLKALRVGGESMWPNIPNGSIVVVDVSDKEFVNGSLFVVNYPEGADLPTAAVKRVQKWEKGLILISDNPDFNTYPPEPTELDWRDLCVGRVIWMWRSLLNY